MSSWGGWQDFFLKGAGQEGGSVVAGCYETWLEFFCLPACGIWGCLWISGGRGGEAKSLMLQWRRAAVVPLSLFGNAGLLSQANHKRVTNQGTFEA